MRTHAYSTSRISFFHPWLTATTGIPRVGFACLEPPDARLVNQALAGTFDAEFLDSWVQYTSNQAQLLDLIESPCIKANYFGPHLSKRQFSTGAQVCTMAKTSSSCGMASGARILFWVGARVLRLRALSSWMSTRTWDGSGKNIIFQIHHLPLASFPRLSRRRRSTSCAMGCTVQSSFSVRRSSTCNPQERNITLRARRQCAICYDVRQALLRIEAQEHLSSLVHLSWTATIAVGLVTYSASSRGLISKLVHVAIVLTLLKPCKQSDQRL